MGHYRMSVIRLQDNVSADRTIQELSVILVYKSTSDIRTVRSVNVTVLERMINGVDHLMANVHANLCIVEGIAVSALLVLLGFPIAHYVPVMRPGKERTARLQEM